MVAHPQTEAGGAKPGGSGRGRHSCPAPGRSPGWSTSSGPAFEPEAPAAALVTFEPKGPAAARAVGGQAPDVDALGRPGSAGGAFREQPLAVVRPDVRGTVFRTVTSADGSRRATSTHAASPRGRAAHRQYDARPFRASTRAVSRPMPLFAPVTTAWPVAPPLARRCPAGRAARRRDGPSVPRVRRDDICYDGKSPRRAARSSGAPRPTPSSNARRSISWPRPRKFTNDDEGPPGTPDLRADFLALRPGTPPRGSTHPPSSAA